MRKKFFLATLVLSAMFVWGNEICSASTVQSTLIPPIRPTFPLPPPPKPDNINGGKPVQTLEVNLSEFQSGL